MPDLRDEGFARGSSRDMAEALRRYERGERTDGKPPTEAQKRFMKVAVHRYYRSSHAAMMRAKQKKSEKRLDSLSALRNRLNPYMTNAATEQGQVPAPSAPEAPATPSPAPEAAVPAAEAPANIGDALDDLTPQQINDFLYKGKTLDLPTDQPSEPEAQAQQPEGEQPQVEATEESDQQVAQEGEESPKFPERLRTGSWDDEAKAAHTMMLHLNKGKKPGDPGFMTLRDVYARLDGEKPKAPEAKAPEAATPSVLDSINAEVEELRTGLETLRAQKREAIENGESVLEIEEKMDAARDAINDAKLKLSREQDRQEMRQAQEAAAKTNAHTEKSRKVQEAVTAEFPSIADKASPLGMEAASVIAELRSDSHEDHALLYTPSAARHVANMAIQRLAERDGISLAQAVSKYSANPAGQPAAQTPPPAAQARKVTPAPGGSQTTQPAGAPTLEQIMADVGDDPIKAQKALAKLQGRDDSRPVFFR